MGPDRKKSDTQRSLYHEKMSEGIFKRVSGLIYDEVGIKMPPAKKLLLEGRLRRRLKALKMVDYEEYAKYIFSPHGRVSEIPELIDVVTTNTTEFFREPNHFDFLTKTLLPAWQQKNNSGKVLRLWSAGCSLGMEPYSLAITFSEYQERNRTFDFSILATDISNTVLASARRAIYSKKVVEDVPLYLLRKYFLRGIKDPDLVRVASEIRKRVLFNRLNLMEKLGFERELDIIFCRNVIIYFDRTTQEILLNKFCKALVPGGHLFIGHSESIAGMELPLTLVAPTVYTLR